MPAWIDSHCHLDSDRFDVDRQDIVDEARRSGVTDIVVPATTARRWEKIHSVCARYDGVHAAYGLHPMFVADHHPDDMSALEAWLAVHPAVAIGECGLDFSSPEWDPDAQRQYFNFQVGLALELAKPLILHARKSLDEIILTLKRHPGSTGVVHSFSGSAEQAKRLAELGIHISVGGAITHDRARRLRSVVAALPGWQLLLETDAPDQPDAMVMGQRNAPHRITSIGAVAAQLRQTSEVDLARLTTVNAVRLFGIERRAAA